MKKLVLLESAFVTLACVLISCTNFSDDRFNNPLDSRTSDGFAATLISEHPEWLDINPETGKPIYWDSILTHVPKDSVPPVITILGGDTVRIPLGDPKNMVTTYMQQVKATDEGGGPVIALEHRNDVNVFKINTVPYTIVYMFADTSGNTASATRYVFIINPPAKDTTPPIITILNPTVYIELGRPFVDEGVSAFDEIDGDLTDQVVKTGTVDVNKVGEYILTYTVSDLSKNAASKTRQVIVRDSTIGPDREKPVITLTPPDTIKLGEGVKIQDYMTTYQEPGFTAIDNIDGNITSKVKVGDIQLLEGKVWYLTYNVNDASGNAAATVRRYFLTTYEVKNLPPIIDLEFPDSVIQLVIPTSGKAVWKEPGYSASDVVDGDITDKVIVDSSNLVSNLGTIGTYTVFYRVTNSAGLLMTVTRLVEVADNPFDVIPPVITLLGGDTIRTLANETFKDPGATAFDNKDKDVTARITVGGEVDTKRLGFYKLTYRCCDNANNCAMKTRVVQVVPDTLTTDLFERYLVPSPDPLPTIPSTYTKFTTFNVDGDGPDLSSITQIEFKWINEENNKQFQMYFTYSGPPNFKDFNSTVQNLASAQPGMTLSGTQITGLDGKYYVVWDDVKHRLIWVRQDKKFAIILTR